MRKLTKPGRLEKDDLVATVSPCNGWAGDPDIKWKYELGVSRLQDIDLRVVAAPNSMRGSEYLAKNPKARAEDIMWAFENKEVRAIIANVGGNDSIVDHHGGNEVMAVAVIEKTGNHAECLPRRQAGHGSLTAVG